MTTDKTLRGRAERNLHELLIEFCTKDSAGQCPFDFQFKIETKPGHDAEFILVELGWSGFNDLSVTKRIFKVYDYLNEKAPEYIQRRIGNIHCYGIEITAETKRSGKDD